MAKWNVYGQVVGSKFLGTFEAETEQEAINQASKSDATWISLCHQCSDQCEDPEIGEIVAEKDE